MCLSRFAGLFSVVPAAILLSVSFFVLFAARKCDGRKLKIFGYAVGGFLWLTCALLLLSGIYNVFHSPKYMRADGQYRMRNKSCGKSRPSTSMGGQQSGTMPMMYKKPQVEPSGIEPQ
ncbi:MAG: hypothetical protein WBE75_06005 [Candidatus Omnitrophota bacterium]|jgi:hypothetical protein